MNETRFLRAHLRATDDAPTGPLHFVASTSNVARDGLVIEPGAWELDNYRKNPVVLWAHDYGGGFLSGKSRTLPVGRTVGLEVRDDGLHADIEFDLEDEFAAAIDRKYRAGYLHAVSVGWDTHEIVHDPDAPAAPPRVTRAELLDISAISVPGDADALIQRQLRGLVAAGLLLDEQISPLEAAGRAGAVLSKRNRDDLERARDLLDAVLRRAASETNDDEDDDEDTENDRAIEALQQLNDRLAALEVA